MRTFRKNAGGNALSKFTGPTRVLSPFEFNYKDAKILDVGDYARVRIFTLSEEDVPTIPCKRGNIVIPNKQKPIGKVVHNLGPALEELTDGLGNPFAEWDSTTLWRVPVWVYGVVRNGVWEDYEKLMFIEIGPGLKKSLDKVKQDPSGMFAFDETTGVPEYDLMLQVVKGDGTIPKNYEFRGINMDPKTKSADANFNVPAEEVLADVANEIADTLESIEWKAAMDERMTVDYIKNEFRPRTQRNDSQSQSQSPISNRFANNEQEQRQDFSNDQYADDAPPIAEQQSEPATPKRGGGRARNFSFGG